MAADSSLLQGEVTEDPKLEVRDAEALLKGFLIALFEEAKLKEAKSLSTLGNSKALV